MKRTATVVSVKGTLMAETVRSEACGDCRACDFGRKEKMHYTLPEGDYKVGDKVELEIADASLPRAALVAYGIPLIGVIIGLTVGSLFTGAEWARSITGVVGLFAGIAALKLTEKKRLQKEKYACRIANAKEE